MGVSVSHYYGSWWKFRLRGQFLLSSILTLFYVSAVVICEISGDVCTFRLSLILDARSEGHMKHPLYVCPFVRSFCSEPFVETFLFFLHEVRVSSNIKSDRAWFFEKNLSLGFLSQEDPKMGLIWGFWSFKKNTQVVCNFLHEVAATWNLKIDLNYFFGKILFLGFCAKRTQNEVFPVSWKINNQNFFDTQHKVTAADIKLT